MADLIDNNDIKKAASEAFASLAEREKEQKEERAAQNRKLDVMERRINDLEEKTGLGAMPKFPQNPSPLTIRSPEEQERYDIKERMGKLEDRLERIKYFQQNGRDITKEKPILINKSDGQHHEVRIANPEIFGGESKILGALGLQSPEERIANLERGIAGAEIEQKKSGKRITSTESLGNDAIAAYVKKNLNKFRSGEEILQGPTGLEKLGAPNIGAAAPVHSNKLEK